MIALVSDEVSWRPDDPWEVSPFGSTDPPFIRLTDRKHTTWTDAQKRAAFAELMPLFAAWEEPHGVVTEEEEVDERSGLEWSPDQECLFNLILPRLESPVLQATYCNSDSMVAEEWTVSYSPEPEGTRREIADVLGRLQAGFNRLSTSAGQLE